MMYSLVSSRVSAPRVSRSASVAVCASSSPKSVSVVPGMQMDRRQALLGAVLSAVTLNVQQAKADGDEFTTFYGLATPPTSYGGYGGNAEEKPKYAFEYPAAWKQGTINKVDKGTKGIDCRLFNARRKEEQVFVISLGRAGEDDKSFKLADIDQTFQGFVGADFNLQDAVSSASEIKKDKIVKDGQDYFIYDIDSPAFRYLCAITVKKGKIFAAFVACPSRYFPEEETKLRAILNSFRTLEF